MLLQPAFLFGGRWQFTLLGDVLANEIGRREPIDGPAGVEAVALETGQLRFAGGA
jgi:hypothetical protein